MLLDKVLCDVIPCVCSLIDHGSRPMKTLEFLTLLYNYSYTLQWHHLSIQIMIIVNARQLDSVAQCSQNCTRIAGSLFRFVSERLRLHGCITSQNDAETTSMMQKF